MWNANNLVQSADAVTVLLAGSIPRLQAWYTALAADARFRVAMQAGDPQDLRSKLVTNPDVLVLDAGIYPGPQPLIEDLTRYHGAAYVLLPMEASRGSHGRRGADPLREGGVQGGDQPGGDSRGDVCGGHGAAASAAECGHGGIVEPSADGGRWSAAGLAGGGGVEPGGRGGQDHRCHEPGV